MSSRGARWWRAAMPGAGPVRTLSAATFVNALGNGVYFMIEVIFFTRSVGLAVHLVALGLGLSALIGLVVAVPTGHAADRMDPRFLLAGALFLAGLVMASFTLVHSFGWFLALAILGAVANSASTGPRAAMMARLGAGEERMRILAYQRAVANFGMGLGVIFTGVGLAVDTRSAYVVMVLGNALTFAVSALVILRLPAMPAASTSDGARREPMSVVLRDWRYLSATLLHGVFAIHVVVMSVALPLWVLADTRAPRWWVSVLLFVNTSMVVAFQIRLSRGSSDVVRAARTFRGAGLLVGLSCVLYGLSRGLGPVPASVLLVAGMVVQSLGELAGVGALWGLGYGLARQDLQGQYQGAFGLGRGIAQVLGPSLVTATAIALGLTGWLILAGMFALSGAAGPALIRSYRRAGLLAAPESAS